MADLVIRPCTRQRTVNGWEFQITYWVSGDSLDTFLSAHEQGSSTSWTPSGYTCHTTDFVTIPDSSHWRVTLKAVENGYNGA